LCSSRACPNISRAVGIETHVRVSRMPCSGRVGPSSSRNWRGRSRPRKQRKRRSKIALVFLVANKDYHSAGSTPPALAFVIKKKKIFVSRPYRRIRKKISFRCGVTNEEPASIKPRHAKHEGSAVLKETFKLRGCPGDPYVHTHGPNGNLFEINSFN
jgi:hypothetical protein